MSHIEKILIASTSNISELTSVALDLENDDVPITYQKDEYGWFILVNRDADDVAYPDTCPAELKALLDYARSLECDWLMLDRDAEPLPGFPQFDW